MRVVIDANILIAAIIKRGKTLELMFEKDIILYAPETLFLELEKYKNIIIKKGRLNEEEFNNIISIFKNNITIIFDGELINYVRDAINTCPDPKDEAYFALALKLNIPIWSNDKELKNQGKVKIYTTEELMRILK